MIGFLLSPFARYVALAIAVAGVLWWAVAAIRSNAVQQERQRIEAINRAARDAADAAGLKAANCDPAKWDRERQTCAP